MNRGAVCRPLLALPRGPTRRRGAACGLLVAFLLTACASPAPAPGSVVEGARIDALVVPGSASKASLLATLGPTQALDFDSGYSVWRYRTAAAGRRGEVIILFGPDGVVRKVRRRELGADEAD